MIEPLVDTWASGEAYEPYVGRWSTLVGREFLPWIGSASGATWLDIGCGTGALSEQVLRIASPAAVTGVDPSQAYVSYARRRLDDFRASFEVGDALALRFEPGSFDVVVSGLVLNFLPDPALAAAEMARVARAGGVVAAYVWDYAAGMEMIRLFWDAAVELNPAARELDEGRRFPICRPPALEGLLTGAALENVQSRAIDVPTRFRNFEDLWSPFLGGQAPAPSYVASLGGGERSRLRERMKERIRTGADGSIELTARAWAVKGSKP